MNRILENPGPHEAYTLVRGDAQKANKYVKSERWCMKYNKEGAGIERDVGNSFIRHI